MNKKGFSLIELLAVIIILGIVATIGISAVSGYVQDSRKSTFADLAKLYAEKASEDRAKDRLPHDIKDGEAILLPIEKYVLEKNEDFSTPYGQLSLDYCYVIITNNKNNFYYYLYLLDDTNHAIVAEEYSKIGKDSVTIEASEIAKILNYRSINATSVLEIDGTNYVLKTHNGQYVVLEKE